MPLLRTLQLSLEFTRPEAVWSLLQVTAAGALAQLTELRLEECRYSSKELEALLSHLPQLAQLVLSVTSNVESLAFLAVPALSTSLRRLTVRGLLTDALWDLPTSEVEHLHSLHQLEELRLLRIVDLTSAERAAYEERPCALLPNLRVFDWQPTVKSELHRL